MAHQDGNIVFLVPPGKIRCFVTGKLRKDTPEEHVRQRWARSLVHEYGYPKADLGIEFKIQIGRSRRKADLVIFKHDAKHVQSEASVVIEAKRDDKRPSDEKYGQNQLISYMSACPACRYGLWVGRERRAFEREFESGQISRIGDIPRFGDESPARPKRTDLVRAHELKSVFRRCHNYIYANAGLQKGAAFHELLKLIFCKTFDEEEGFEELVFSINPKERATESGQRRLMEERLQPLFARIKHKFPFIFGPDERIDLDHRVAAYVVHELQHVSLLETTTDVKGDAYEELVGENLRGDRGEFFTPRNVCDAAVRMVMSLYPVNELPSLKVLDCCCGTGGFLVSWLSNLARSVSTMERLRNPELPEEIVKERVRTRVKDVCGRNMYGLDINPELVRTCQMNLVLHGDGSSNVFRVDSVRSPGEWDEQARLGIPYGQIDVVVTNPPFGGNARIDDAHVLDQYELTNWAANSQRSSMPAEQLFVEASLKFVKPGGYLAIVLPDGILNNPGLLFIRTWILNRARIVASIQLPKTTFKASGGVNNPSLLLVQKFTRNMLQTAKLGAFEGDYEIFMATPKTSGINNRSKPVYLRHPNGQERLADNGEKLIDDEIQSIPTLFERWARSRIPV